MLKTALATLALLVAAPASAQQSPSEQALAGKLMQEINNNLQCQTALITASKELEELKKKHDNGTPSPPK